MNPVFPIPREIPPPHSVLPASFEDLNNGTARITIGAISSIYANATTARQWLNVLAKRGQVQLVDASPTPC